MPFTPFTPTTQPKKYNLGVPDVAELYGLSTRTVYRLLAQGRLKGHRIGTKVIRFNAEEVEAALVGGR
jgi:excisionase family DNA binding protein